MHDMLQRLSVQSTFLHASTDLITVFSHVSSNKNRNKMVHRSYSEKQLIYKVYLNFKKEASRGRLMRKVDNFLQRTLDAVGISKTSMYHIIREMSKANSNDETKENTVIRRSKFDDFDKKLVARVAYGFFDRNEMLTVGRLQAKLRDDHELSMGKLLRYGKIYHSENFAHK